MRLNISERKNIEQSLEESETRYHTLLDGASQVILIHKDCKLIYANQACADMYGS
jgi:PAS domain-containing protein